MTTAHKPKIIDELSNYYQYAEPCEWDNEGNPTKAISFADGKKYAGENPDAEEISMKTIQKGSTGKVVRVWQIIAGVNPDGDFGAKTVIATKKFQKDHGLKEDGVVGRQTWNKGFATL